MQQINLMWYFAIGIAYLLVNVLIRKMEVDDWMIALMWIFLWPICWIALAIDTFNKLIRKGK